MVIKSKKQILTLNNKNISISNLNKIWFPRSKITKGEILDYYYQVQEYIMNHVKNHILVMQRYPEGISGESFYQKNASNYFPSWIKKIPIEKENGEMVNYVVCTDPAIILYLVNQGALVLHAWLSRYDKLDYPDRMIFDLDPSVDDFPSVRRAALLLKSIFDDLKIPSYAMTTGSRGIHVLVPLKRIHTFDQIAEFSFAIARRMIEESPRQFTLEIRKNKRDDKIFIDTLRNRSSATSVIPYSVRAYEKAPVAAPLWWEEVAKSNLTSQKFTIKTMLARLKSDGDPWDSMYENALSLKKIKL